MTLRRQPKPTLEPEFAPLVAELWLAYEEGMARCYEVARAEQIDDELRGRALATACRIAYVSRATWEAMLNLNLVDRLPKEFNPVRGLAASARLAYSLTATAEADPEPETLLSIGELDGVPVAYELSEWLQTFERTASGGKG